jgi:Domain of unknown function DUF87.
VWEVLLLGALFLSTLENGVFIGLGKRGPVYLSLDRHIVITGPTRSGKTTLAKKLIKRSGLPALVVDWHGEYELPRVDARRLKISIKRFDKKLLAEILGLALNLNEPSVYFLYRAIRQYPLAALRDVVTALDDFLVTTRSEVEMKAAIARRLEYIIDVFEDGAISLEKLFKVKKAVAVDLSKLRLYEEKVLIALFILASLYNYLFERGVAGGPERLLVVDEAQNIVKRGDVVKHLVFESAKFGLRVVLVSNEMPPQELLVHAIHIITQPHYTYNIKIKRSALIKNNKIEELWII